MGDSSFASMPPEHDENAERPKIRSAPPPDFDDDPVQSATKQTPKEELQRWRRLARQRDEEVTRSVADPLAADRELHAHDVPTREIQLASDVVALGRTDARGPPRPAIPPAAHSIPPEAVPQAPPIGVSVPPGLLSQSLPAPRARREPARSRSRWPFVVAAVVLVGGAGVAALVVVTPAELGWGPRELGPVSPPDPSVSPGPPTTTALTVPTSPDPPGAASVPPSPAAEPEAPSPSGPAEDTPGASPDRGPGATSAELLVDQGDGAARSGDAERALELYQQAIALDAHHPHAFAGAARACLALGRAEEAVRFAERAVANRRRRPAFRVLLGDARSAAGDEEGARREWEEALALDPEDAAALSRLGR